MDRVVLAENRVFARVKLQTSLPDDDVIRKDFLPAKLLDTSINRQSLPRRRPAESFVFCVDDACILEAKKRSW